MPGSLLRARMLVTCARMVVRRLALRRTVALTAAGLLALGLFGVYYVYRGDGRAEVREITVVSRERERVQ